MPASVLCSPLEKHPSGHVALKIQRAGEPVQRQPAVLLSSHLPPEHPSGAHREGHTGMTPRLSLPDTALGQPERGPAHVRVSSLLHQGWDHKVRARSHGTVGALPISQCLTSPGGRRVTAVPRLGTVPRASPKCKSPRFWSCSAAGVAPISSSDGAGRETQKGLL